NGGGYRQGGDPGRCRRGACAGHGADGHGRRGRKPSSLARTVVPVTTVDALLAVYDRQMRGVEPKPPAGVRYERDGPLLRVVGGHRGYISGPRDIGVTGAELDRLIARQRDCFAGRGEAVGWQTRAHDEPADLTARLRAAGFVPGETDTVLIGLTAELATAPCCPAVSCCAGSPRTTTCAGSPRCSPLSGARTGAGSATTSSPGSPLPRR